MQVALPHELEEAIRIHEDPAAAAEECFRYAALCAGPVQPSPGLRSGRVVHPRLSEGRDIAYGDQRHDCTPHAEALFASASLHSPQGPAGGILRLISSLAKISLEICLTLVSKIASAGG